MNRSLLLFLLALTLLFVLPGCGGGQADDDDDTSGEDDNYGYWADSAGVAPSAPGWQGRIGPIRALMLPHRI